MAEHTTATLKSKLAADLDRARTGMSASWNELRSDANLRAHVQSSFQRHKGAWLGAASILGWILARLPSRQKKILVDKHGKTARVNKSGGLLLGLLGLAMPLMKPALTAFVTAKLSELAARKGKFDKPPA